MNLFLGGPLFMTGDGPKIVHFGPKMAEHGRPVNVPKWSKKGPKGTKMVDPSVFDHLGPFWALKLAQVRPKSRLDALLFQKS